ncbi:hypothetical protein A2673_03025 [Candidatus Kaiserbacteria bacterium RIFCSPHIGHO2_01_FULL_50_13]|nr:MAG: hypothetical protein A2673_03025 [Candidatus Kaiserbacteria bacterium RIFCSPHIGHO2_01_FULL_50_13]OGG81128.1 MAG: hypothetical protein A3H74_01580 [Candidatus Kaiserbacteria bacterium RIFCSPLOWO2_02_FULL_51_13]
MKVAIPNIKASIPGNQNADDCRGAGGTNVMYMNADAITKNNAATVLFATAIIFSLLILKLLLRSYNKTACDCLAVL